MCICSLRLAFGGSGAKKCVFLAPRLGLFSNVLLEAVGKCGVCVPIPRRVFCGRSPEGLPKQLNVRVGASVNQLS